MKFNDDFRINPLICCGLGPGGAGSTGGQENDGGAGPGGMGAGPGGESDGMGDGSGGRDNAGYDADMPGGGISKDQKGVEKSLADRFINMLIDGVGKVIDGLTLTNPITAAGNLGVKSFTDKSVGQHLAGIAKDALNNALKSGATQVEAQEASSKAVATAIGQMNPDDIGGKEYQQEAINYFNSNAATENARQQLSDTANEESGDTATKIPTRSNTDEAQTYNYEEGKRPLWENLVNEFFETAWSNYSDQAGAVKDSIGEYKNSLESAGNNYYNALDNYSKGINNFTNEYHQGLTSSEAERRDARDLFSTNVRGATDTQNSLLDRLSGKLESNSQITPMAFSIGGQQYSFIPRSQKETISQLADMGQTKYSNSMAAENSINTNWNSAQDVIDDLRSAKFTTGADKEQKLYEASNYFADRLKDIDESKLKAALAEADVDPNMTYMDAFAKLVDMESAIVKTDTANSLSQLSLDQGQQRIDQNEPGFIEYAKGIGSLASGASSFFRW